MVVKARAKYHKNGFCYCPAFLFEWILLRTKSLLTFERIQNPSYVRIKLYGFLAVWFARLD